MKDSVVDSGQLILHLTFEYPGNQGIPFSCVCTLTKSQLHPSTPLHGCFTKIGLPQIQNLGFKYMEDGTQTKIRKQNMKTSLVL